MEHTDGQKDEIITFKVDNHLAGILRRLPNRSQFIRTAVLISLDHMCPLCQGSGILSPNQKRHWQDFSRHHGVRECVECGSVHLVCKVGDR